jgi:hypothetical protein
MSFDPYPRLYILSATSPMNNGIPFIIPIISAVLHVLSTFLTSYFPIIPLEIKGNSDNSYTIIYHTVTMCPKKHNAHRLIGKDIQNIVGNMPA